ncbi:hypothetical protein BJ742DRAFT_840273 [Cladochytrium replicatum]|nr:hypothetical protein BJ742DRAFT_840273 [Cladochytrium replicatum]
MSFAVVDTHSHLGSPSFSTDEIPDLLSRARSAPASVKSVIAVSESLENLQLLLDIALNNPSSIHVAAGIHPVQRDGTSSDPSLLPPFLSYVQKNADRLVAIGEIGLDFTPHVIGKPGDPTTEPKKQAQKETFASLLHLANALNLPVSIHSRNAGHHAIDVLETHARTPVVLHAYDGRAATVRRALQLGYYFSVAPIVVREERFRKLVELVPIERLVLESDAPALGPVKGERNEPKNLEVAARVVAEIKGVSFEQVCRITTENALRIFPKLSSGMWMYDDVSEAHIL